MKLKIYSILPFYLLLIILLFLISFKPLKSLDYSGALYSSKGELLSYKIAKDEQWRLPLRDLNVPWRLKVSLINLEDKRFFSHAGVDFIALIRALSQNFKNKKIVSGASTLTMQLARLNLKNKKRNLFNKIRESLYAVQLDFFLSKEEILHEYFQRAPYGGNLIGLETASWFYFKRPTKHLSWSEAALLAVLPQTPSYIRINKNRVLLKNKRDALLKKLNSLKIFDQTTLNLSLKEKIPKSFFKPAQVSPHLLQASIKKNKKNTNNLSFKSSINYDLQKQSLKVLRNHINELKGSHIHNLALVIIDNLSGKPIAFHGNVVRENETKNNSFVNIALAKRSSGSTLKPFLYGLMLDEGVLTPEMILYDIPTTINGFQPKNFTGNYVGAIKAKKALAMSLNIPAVRMLKDYGLKKFYHDLKEFDFSQIFRNADDYGLSLILGGAEVNLFELTRAYSYMAQTALNKEFILSSNVLGSKINTIKPILSPGAAFLTLEALLEVKRPGILGYWKDFSGSQKISWKTGTSHGFKDAWAIGVNQKYSVGVWVGNATGEGRPEIIGTKTAAPVLFSVFNLLNQSDWFEPAEVNFKSVSVCKNSGYLSHKNCNAKEIQLPFKSYFNLTDSFNKKIAIDKLSRKRVHLGCRNQDQISFKRVFILPHVVSYYTKNKGQFMPDWASDCFNNQILTKENSLISFIYPKNKSKIILPTEIDGLKKPLVVLADHHNNDIEIFWHLNQTFLGSTKRLHSKELWPIKGENKLTLVDSKGKSESLFFEVL